MPDVYVYLQYLVLSRCYAASAPPPHPAEYTYRAAEAAESGVRRLFFLGAEKMGAELSKWVKLHLERINATNG